MRHTFRLRAGFLGDPLSGLPCPQSVSVSQGRTAGVAVVGSVSCGLGPQLPTFPRTGPHLSRRGLTVCQQTAKRARCLAPCSPRRWDRVAVGVLTVDPPARAGADVRSLARRGDAAGGSAQFWKGGTLTEERSNRLPRHPHPDCSAAAMRPASGGRTQGPKVRTGGPFFFSPFRLGLPKSTRGAPFRASVPPIGRASVGQPRRVMTRRPSRRGILGPRASHLSLIEITTRTAESLERGYPIRPHAHRAAGAGA